MTARRLTKGKLYRLGVERPLHGIGCIGSYKWQEYTPRVTLYRKPRTEDEQFAGYANKDNLGEVFTDELVMFLEETDTWVCLLVEDRVGWIKKGQGRISLNDPEREVWEGHL